MRVERSRNSNAITKDQVNMKNETTTQRIAEIGRNDVEKRTKSRFHNVRSSESMILALTGVWLYRKKKNLRLSRPHSLPPEPVPTPLATSIQHTQNNNNNVYARFILHGFSLSLLLSLSSSLLPPLSSFSYSLRCSLPLNSKLKNIRVSRVE